MMRHGDLSGRVTWSGLAAVIALSAVAGWAAGVEGAAGGAGGGAGAPLDFRWLARSVANAAALVRDGGSGGAALRGAWLRHLSTVGALGLLLGSGWAHPPRGTLGRSGPPPLLGAPGVRAAREAD